MTNFLTLTLITVVTTNWVNLPGDFKREGGTNYLKQQQLIQTNVYVEEVTLCTNRTNYKITQGTNGPVRWFPTTELLRPGVPGRQ